MHWTAKAHIQRTCSKIPMVGDLVYYGLQRAAGGLRHAPPPAPYFRAVRDIASDLQRAGVSLEGARLMEVGTGRGLEVPMGLYLCGAAAVHTYDLYRILLDWRIDAMLSYFAAQSAAVADELAPFSAGGAAGVLERIRSLTAGQPSAAEAIRRMGIHYYAPADAAASGLPDGSIDAQISFTVFEHIPGEIIERILREASRVLRPGGVTVHHIDLSDHFAHEDGSISLVNFLQYPQKEWDRIAGNRYAYHNRLRVTPMHNHFRAAGHEILWHTTWRDERSERELRNGLRVAPEYAGQSVEELATVGSRVVSAPRRG